MKKLVEIRNQEFICRERALRDSQRKIFWLAQRPAADRAAQGPPICLGGPGAPTGREYANAVSQASLRSA
jgi:hypothetical protein